MRSLRPQEVLVHCCLCPQLCQTSCPSRGSFWSMHGSIPAAPAPAHCAEAGLESPGTGRMETSEKHPSCVRSECWYCSALPQGQIPHGSISSAPHSGLCLLCPFSFSLEFLPGADGTGHPKGWKSKTRPGTAGAHLGWWPQVHVLED